MKYSIIIPVYNVEKYLEKCINSVLSQNIEDYEVILIDDGSTDKSPEICDLYAKGNPKISCRHKENGGLSDARNCGIEQANGDYLLFVDSDDYLEENCLKEIAGYLDHQPDVLITRFVEVYPDKEYFRDERMCGYKMKFISKSEAINWIMKESYNTWPAQKYIVSTKFVNANHIRFKKGYLHEDIDWTIRLCIYGEKFCMCDTKWYYHVMVREGSIMNVVRPKRIVDVLDMAFDFIEGSSRQCLLTLKKTEQSVVINRIMKSVYPTLMLCKDMDDESFDFIDAAYKRYNSIFAYAPNVRYRLFSIFCNIFGIKKAIRLASKFN